MSESAHLAPIGKILREGTIRQLLEALDAQDTGWGSATLSADTFDIIVVRGSVDLQIGARPRLHLDRTIAENLQGVPPSVSALTLANADTVIYFGPVGFANHVNPLVELCRAPRETVEHNDECSGGGMHRRARSIGVEDPLEYCAGCGADMGAPVTGGEPPSGA